MQADVVIAPGAVPEPNRPRSKFLEDEMRWDEMTRDAAESAPCTVSVLYGIGDRQLSVKYLKRV